MSSVGWLVLQVIVAIIVLGMIGSVHVETVRSVNCWRLLEAPRLMDDVRGDGRNLQERAIARERTWRRARRAASDRLPDHMTPSRRHVS